LALLQLLQLFLNSIKTVSVLKLGLSDLSDVETKVFLAISDLCNQFETAKTQAVLQHELVASIGRATIFRAIKKLEDRDKIAKSQDQYGAYSIADSAM